MKYLSCILFIFLIFNTNSTKADNIEKKLDELFNELKNNNVSSSYEIEQKISWVIGERNLDYVKEILLEHIRNIKSQNS